MSVGAWRSCCPGETMPPPPPPTFTVKPETHSRERESRHQICVRDGEISAEVILHVLSIIVDWFSLILSLISGEMTAPHFEIPIEIALPLFSALVWHGGA
ncbi:hypothetical protein NL676_018872 [Syzygium grande]|nr:hypothetical protein NL676_018872 [Syzygium grande]